MGEQLLTKLLPALEKMSWPTTGRLTQLGMQSYAVGLEKVDSFKGDPKVLAAALRTFQTGDSLPFACAGVAYTLLAAGREPDGSYSQSGLDQAMEWLEKAQALEPDIVEINVVEAFIYIYSDRYDDARLILDYLARQDSHNFYLATAEIAYWQRQKLLDEAVHWYEEAIKLAATVPQRLRLRKQLGDCYLEHGQLDEAREVYQEVVHFDKENPWLWHNMSLIYWRQENYKEAKYCNKRALALFDFPAARQMEERLKKKLDTGGLLGRLFGG